MSLRSICDLYMIYIIAIYIYISYCSRCFCGAADTDYGRYGTATCDSTCAGDPSLICGGTFAMNIFMAY